MSSFVSSAAYAASKHLSAHQVEIKRSHVIEVMAALLGYRSYAALTVDEADTSLTYHLDDAEFVVLNAPLGRTRCTELGVSESEPIVDACVGAMQSQRDHVYPSIADFYDSYAREALASAILNSDGVGSAMAESNAEFPDDPSLPSECPQTDDLWEARDQWTIAAEGELTGEYDHEGDRMYNGDTLRCRGWLIFSKAGRAGLVFDEDDGAGIADDSWRRDERDDEMPDFL